VSAGFPSKGGEYHAEYMVAEFNSLLKLASREELGDAIAATLANPQKRAFFGDAISLSMMLGPQFDRSKIVSAIRGNLAQYFVLDEAKNLGGYGHTLIKLAAYELCYYGTEADVKLVNEFAAQVAKSNPSLAKSLEYTVFDRTKVLELRAKAANPATAQDQEKQQSLMPPLSNLQAVQSQAPKKSPEAKPASPPSGEPTSSTPWSIIVVLIVAAIALLWLLVKKRK
jgi:hypothetical protein